MIPTEKALEAPCCFCELDLKQPHTSQPTLQPTPSQGPCTHDLESSESAILGHPKWEIVPLGGTMKQELSTFSEHPGRAVTTGSEVPVVLPLYYPFPCPLNNCLF